MKHYSLCSGIGGSELAAELCGIDNVFQIEINTFCCNILDKKFNGKTICSDISIIEWGSLLQLQQYSYL